MYSEPILIAENVDRDFHLFDYFEDHQDFTNTVSNVKYVIESENDELQMVVTLLVLKLYLQNYNSHMDTSRSVPICGVRVVHVHCVVLYSVKQVSPLAGNIKHVA